MSRVNYTDAPTSINTALDDAQVIEDLLPTPAELVKKTEKEKITIALDKRSVELFKDYAKKNNAKYQSMMNSVLSSYADKFLSRK